MQNETQGSHAPVSYATITGILHFLEFMYLYVLLSTHVTATPKEWSKAAAPKLSLRSTPYPPSHALYPPPHPCVLPHILLGVLHHAFWRFIATPMFVSCV